MLFYQVNKKLDMVRSILNKDETVGSRHKEVADLLSDNSFNKLLESVKCVVFPDYKREEKPKPQQQKKAVVQAVITKAEEPQEEEKRTPLTTSYVGGGDTDVIIGLSIMGGALLAIVLFIVFACVFNWSWTVWQWLIGIDAYRTKRDKLVEERGTKHIPAASFFKGTDFLGENTLVNAMPNEYLTKYFRLDQKSGKLTDQICTEYLPNFYYFSDDIILHKEWTEESSNLDFKSKYKNLDLSFGVLRNENERYYFSIALENNVELRILYNWSYDHIYNQAFDDQNRNNISVCFSIVAGSSKFVSFGDLGFGETGLINYYRDTNILKNISCFKASHHGSTNNGENSQELFELMQAAVIVVPGVAQINREILGVNSTDPIYGGLKSTAVMKMDFFSNVTKGKADAKIYCTQVAQLLDTQSGFSLISAPLYGDITVNFTNDAVKVDCSYKGEIDSYVSGFSDEMKHFKFSNTKDGVMLSYNETDHWKAIYQDNGKSQGE